MPLRLTDKQSREINRRIADRMAERRKAAVMDAVKVGVSFMGRGKPLERLNGYVNNTYAPDAIELLDRGWLERKKRGEPVEPLLAEKMQAAYAEQLQAQERALQMGIDPAIIPPLEEPLLFWPKVLRVAYGVDVALELVRDWRTLRNTQARRETPAEVTY